MKHTNTHKWRSIELTIEYSTGSQTHSYVSLVIREHILKRHKQ